MRAFGTISFFGELVGEIAELLLFFAQTEIDHVAYFPLNSRTAFLLEGANCLRARRRSLKQASWAFDLEIEDGSSRRPRSLRGVDGLFRA